MKYLQRKGFSKKTKCDEGEFLSFPERHPYFPMILAIIALIISYTK